MISGVYFLKVPYNGIILLKIGCSKDVYARIKVHQASNPLIEVLGVIQCDKYFELEREIHLKCKSYKFKREWFYFNVVVLNYIESLEGFTFGE